MKPPKLQISKISKSPNLQIRRCIVNASRCCLVLLLAWLCAPTQSSAQSRYAPDSIAFTNAMWVCDTLDGFYYRSCHFTSKQIFNSNQYFCIIEIPRTSKAHLLFAADTLLTRVSDFAIQHKALAGINGSYFDMRTGVPVCYLRIAGRQLGENTPQAHDSVNRKYYQNGTLRLTRTGRPRFLIPDTNRLAETKLPDSNIMTAGPMLIHCGEVVPQRLDRRFVYQRHNRTALGLKRDGTIILLVADGRAKDQCSGLSIPELTRIMRWLGCAEAVNLDGGGSTTMYIKGRGEEGIVNHPSDNGRFDAKGQRRVANAILVVKD